jgi:hypothetical protein
MNKKIKDLPAERSRERLIDLLVVKGIENERNEVDKRLKNYLDDMLLEVNIWIKKS